MLSRVNRRATRPRSWTELFSNIFWILLSRRSSLIRIWLLWIHHLSQDTYGSLPWHDQDEVCDAEHPMSKSDDTFPWEGYYIEGVPVRITAIPNEGYKFVGWKNRKLPKTSSIVTSLDQETEFIQIFKKSGRSSVTESVEEKRKWWIKHGIVFF